MKLPVIALIGVAIVFQTGCVTGRRSFALPVPSHDIPPATQGKVYITAVTDDREFQNRPSDPSIPSIDGDVTKLSSQERDRMIVSVWPRPLDRILPAERCSLTRRMVRGEEKIDVEAGRIS